MAPRVETFGRIRGSSPDRVLEEDEELRQNKIRIIIIIIVLKSLRSATSNLAVG
jgi:hypothetical protein